MKKFLRHKKFAHNLNLFLTGIFAFHFFLFHGIFSGYVLCIGNDGHVAVERSVDDTTCADDEELFHQNTIEEHSENCCSLDSNHCGECRDISFTADCQDEQIRNPQRSVEIQPIQPLIFSAPQSDTCGFEYHHQNPALSYLTSHYLSLTALQTTVLLI